MSTTSPLVVIGSPSVPGTPVAVKGNASAVVSWTAPATDNGSAIVAYSVRVYTGGVNVARKLYGSPATTQTVTGLTSGKSYTFTVGAINYRGAGPVSPPSNAVTPS
jgi:hypothetical protein